MPAGTNAKKKSQSASKKGYYEAQKYVTERNKARREKKRNKDATDPVKKAKAQDRKLAKIIARNERVKRRPADYVRGPNKRNVHLGDKRYSIRLFDGNKLVENLRIEDVKDTQRDPKTGNIIEHGFVVFITEKNKLWKLPFNEFGFVFRAGVNYNQ